MDGPWQHVRRRVLVCRDVVNLVLGPLMSLEAEPTPERDHDPVDQAWRIGTVPSSPGQAESTPRRPLLSRSSPAMAAGVIAMSGGDRALSHMEDWFEQWAYSLGVTSLAVGLLSVALVVRPRLRARHANGEAAENFIYFGHARRWHPEELERALRESDMLPILTRQVVAMSDVAWLKHRLLQASLTSAGLSAALLAVAAYANAHVYAFAEWRSRLLNSHRQPELSRGQETRWCMCCQSRN